MAKDLRNSKILQHIQELTLGRSKKRSLQKLIWGIVSHMNAPILEYLLQQIEMRRINM